MEFGWTDVEMFFKFGADAEQEMNLKAVFEAPQIFSTQTMISEILDMKKNLRKFIMPLALGIFMLAFGSLALHVIFIDQKPKIVKEKNTSPTRNPEEILNAQCNLAIFEMLLYGSEETSFRHLPLTTEEKRLCFEHSAVIQGEAIQLLRIFCWIIEPDGELRKEILRQWLGQLKYESNLPPEDNLMDNLFVLMRNFNTDEKNIRRLEFVEVYESLEEKPIFIKKETDFSFGTQSLKKYKPFLDIKYPLGTVLFSADEKLIFDAYKETIRLRGLNPDYLVPDIRQELPDRAIIKLLGISEDKRLQSGKM